MVTTFTYKPSLVRIDAHNFELSWLQTHKATNTQTNRQDRLQYTALLASVQCNYKEVMQSEIECSVHADVWQCSVCKYSANGGSGVSGLVSLATVPKVTCNQEPLVVKDKDVRSQVSLAWASTCYFIPSVLWHCWLGDRKGIRPVKSWVSSLLLATIWLELCTSYSSSCHHHFHHPCSNEIQNDGDLVPVYRVVLENWPLDELLL